MIKDTCLFPIADAQSLVCPSLEDSRMAARLNNDNQKQVY
jgi:hypothetical protein